MAISKLKVQSLPGAVLSCFAKKVPKECDIGEGDPCAPAHKIPIPYVPHPRSDEGANEPLCVCRRVSNKG